MIFTTGLWRFSSKFDFILLLLKHFVSKSGFWLITAAFFRILTLCPKIWKRGTTVFVVFVCKRAFPLSVRSKVKVRRVEVFVSFSEVGVSSQLFSCHTLSVLLHFLPEQKFLAVTTFHGDGTFIWACAWPVGGLFAERSDGVCPEVSEREQREGVKSSQCGQRCQKNKTKVVLVAAEKQQATLLFPAEQQKTDGRQQKQREICSDRHFTNMCQRFRGDKTGREQRERERGRPRKLKVTFIGSERERQRRHVKVFLTKIWLL